MVIRWAIAIVLVALFGGYAVKLRSAPATSSPPPQFAEVSKSVAGWYGEDVVITDGTGNLLGADSFLRRLYRDESGAEVMLFIAYFARQKVNSQIHSPRNCLPGGGWKVDRVETVQGMPGDRVRLVIRKGGQTQEVLYWFHTQVGSAADEYELKWNLVKTALRGRPTNAAFVRYSAAISDSTEMRELMRLLDSQIGQALVPAGIS